MMKNAALCSRYSWWRIEVPVLLSLSALLLMAGLLLPLVHVEKMMFWKNDYSVMTGVRSLWHQQQWLLAIVVFFFSILFPSLTLLVLAGIWFLPLVEDQRQRVLHWLGILGKWSMLDVFAVAILIVLVKLGPVARIDPQRGVYAFACAIVLSMITTMYVTHLARTE